MGGIGSGRPCTNSLTSELFRLNVLQLQAAGLLEAGLTGRIRLHRSGPHVADVVATRRMDHLLLSLDLGRDLFGQEMLRLVIRLGWSECNYGETRPWFICPGTNCGRWATLLYGRRDFLCRRCRRVSYQIQRVHPRSRALARAQAVRLRLGGSPDVTQPFPPRPKGMHDWTYTTIAIKGFAAELKASKGVVDLLGPSRSAKTSREVAGKTGGRGLFDSAD